MKVFISSVIGGFESYRDAAASGVKVQGHEVVRAEDLGAQIDSPRVACLEAVRRSDVTLVILGGRYGDVQPSGLSATHEEFREARESSSILVFVEKGVDREADQQEFITEAQAWASGHFTASFTRPDELRDAVIRGLSNVMQAQQSWTTDPAALIERARSLIPATRGFSGSSLHVAVSCGPIQDVLPPMQASDSDLRTTLEQAALFGPTQILDRQQGHSVSSRVDGLRLEQQDANAQIRPDASMTVSMPARDRDARHGLPAIIEEDIADRLSRALRFMGSALDLIDDRARIRDVVILAGIAGGALGWRTRAEHAANPSAMSLSMTSRDLVVVPRKPGVRPRASLSSGVEDVVQDLIARLRQEIRS